MSKTTNTIIIGAGQSGLSLSYLLTKKGIEHLILERGQVGEEWRSRRWDAFHLITPNFMTQLPGFPYKGSLPNGFDSKDQVIKYFEDYAKSFKAPIIEKTEVISVTKNKDRFIVKTNSADYEAKNVIVAVGSFHKPLIPEISKKLPKTMYQIHSSAYKNTKQLPEGDVLVIGGGNSGIQIAVDINKAGRKTYLSIGRVRIVPRKYRGKDFMEWAEVLGILDRKTEETSDEIKNTPPPILFGNSETVDLRKLAKDGVQLVGRLKAIENSQFTFDTNVQESIEKGENALVGFKATVDKYIADSKLNVEVEDEVLNTLEMPRSLDNLDLNNVKSVIWSTGFKDDWSWLDLDILGEDGQPIHSKGVSKIPGLYFIGLRWLSKYKSFLLCGVAEDAEYLADKITF
jgi:putative flavoprotein involved in K+ transport